MSQGSTLPPPPAPAPPTGSASPPLPALGLFPLPALPPLPLLPPLPAVLSPASLPLPPLPPGLSSPSSQATMPSVISAALKPKIESFFIGTPCVGQHLAKPLWRLRARSVTFRCQPSPICDEDYTHVTLRTDAPRQQRPSREPA